MEHWLSLFLVELTEGKENQEITGILLSLEGLAILSYFAGYRVAEHLYPAPGYDTTQSLKWSLIWIVFGITVVLLYSYSGAVPWFPISLRIAALLVGLALGFVYRKFTDPRGGQG